LHPLESAASARRTPKAEIKIYSSFASFRKRLVSALKAADKIVANPSLGLLEGQQVKVVQAANGYEPGQVQGNGTPALQAADHQSKPASPNPFTPQDPNGARQAAMHKQSISK
jgi:hypothetical protein